MILLLAVMVVIMVTVADRIEWAAIRADIRTWRKQWRHHAKHRPRPPRGYTGSVRITVRQVIATIRTWEDEQAALLYRRRTLWVPLDVTP